MAAAVATEPALAPASRAIQRLDKDHLPAVREWWASVDNVLIDCDGVLWRAVEGVQGVDRALATMRAAGKRVFFVSNNSTKSRASYCAKLLATCGIPAAEDEVVSSAYAAALWCRAAGLTRKVYVVGQDGLVEELRRVGLEVVGPDDFDKPFAFGSARPEDLDPDVEAVVAGFDGRMSYYKISTAVAYLRYGPACRFFVATNRDATFPDTHMTIAGGGVVIAAIEAGAQRAPDVVAGKPSAGMLDIIAASAGLDRARSCMIGDRLDTDIAFGNGGGLGSTLLVLTGVSTLVEAEGVRDARRPTHVLASLGDLADLLVAAGDEVAAAAASAS